MRKIVSNLFILCAGALVGLYGIMWYNNTQVEALAALIPWIFILISEITTFGEKK